MSMRLSNLIAETHMAEVSLQYREDVATGGISGLWYLLIPVAAVAIAVVIYKIFDRPPPIVNTPDGLLHELCKVHQINAAGRRLLERIAEDADLDHPATVFLSAGHFEAAVQDAGKRMRYGRREQSVLGMLRRRLFAA
jgi:hypothetical protein